MSDTESEISVRSLRRKFEGITDDRRNSSRFGIITDTSRQNRGNITNLQKFCGHSKSLGASEDSDDPDSETSSVVELSRDRAATVSSSFPYGRNSSEPSTPSPPVKPPRTFKHDEYIETKKLLNQNRPPIAPRSNIKPTHNTVVTQKSHPPTNFVRRPSRRAPDPPPLNVAQEPLYSEPIKSAKSMPSLITRMKKSPKHNEIFGPYAVTDLFTSHSTEQLSVSSDEVLDSCSILIPKATRSEENLIDLSQYLDLVSPEKCWTQKRTTERVTYMRSVNKHKSLITPAPVPLSHPRSLAHSTSTSPTSSKPKLHASVYVKLIKSLYIFKLPNQSTQPLLSISEELPQIIFQKCPSTTSIDCDLIRSLIFAAYAPYNISSSSKNTHNNRANDARATAVKCQDRFLWMTAHGNDGFSCHVYSWLAVDVSLCFVICSDFLEPKFFKDLLLQMRACHLAADLNSDLILSQWLTYYQDTPQPGDRLELDEGGRVSLQFPLDTRLGDAEGCSSLMEIFSADVLLEILASFLLERRIVLVSSLSARLVSFSQTILSLLYPLKFDFMYWPVCPPELVLHVTCMAGLPYLVGIRERDLSKFTASVAAKCDRLLIVHLDTGTIMARVGDERAIIPPKMDQEFRKAINISLNATDSHTRDDLIGEACLQLMINLFGHCANFLDPDPLKILDRKSFIKSVPGKKHRQFLTWFCESRLFGLFSAHVYKRNTQRKLEPASHLIQKMTLFERKTQEIAPISDVLARFESSTASPVHHQHPPNFTSGSVRNSIKKRNRILGII